MQALLVNSCRSIVFTCHDSADPFPIARWTGLYLVRLLALDLGLLVFLLD